MDLSTWKRKHGEWTSARDRLGIKSGYVKDVSIGDSIDNVSNEWKKSLDKLQSALRELITDIGKYKDAVRKKYPEAVDWLEKNLEKSAMDLEKEAINAFQNADACVKQIEIFKTERAKYSFPDGDAFLKVWRNLKSPQDWPTDSARLYDQLRASANRFRRFATEIQGYARNMTVVVPGKVQAGDFLEEAERILGESDALLDLAETQQVGSEAFQDKARFCRDTYVIIEYGVSQLAENAKRYSGIEKTAKPRILFPSSG
ncbi:hypothetical protein WKW80_22755 [Variovorax humicola]|uniref:Uncharacterized protein n=1 Tax=Variovorax humicola TaxID=1769758 RepID=A0ABU8W432_9BURK